jgi:hypothetical protein
MVAGDQLSVVKGIKHFYFKSKAPDWVDLALLAKYWLCF